MSQYAVGKEPKCPLHHPGCAGIIRNRGAKSCQPCSQWKAPVEPAPAPERLLAADREKAKALNELNIYKLKYGVAKQTIERQEQELAALGVLQQNVAPAEIKPVRAAGDAEGTIVLVASDWHLEEKVERAQTNGVNEYNLDIAHERVQKFFRSSLRLIRLLQQDIHVQEIILALLGDFISNDIHEEFLETNALTPMDAIVMAQNEIISGIDYLLANSSLRFTIPCHSGNHARTTHKTRHATENGHSLEYLMYLHLKAYYRNEPRVNFLVSQGYHTYVQVYDMTLRFHHGHNIKYQGGIGGIFIPAFKAISQWDKLMQADLDIFGHFHQHKDGGKFVSNGSLIGYNTFALSIKADYEPPNQTLMLLDKKRGRTCTWPILFTR